MLNINDIKTASKELKLRFENNSIPIKKMYLFGSYAKNTAHEYSDIDIALVSDKFSGTRFYDVEKIISFTNDLNPFFEFHPYTTESFNENNEWFVKEIIDTGIEL